MKSIPHRVGLLLGVSLLFAVAAQADSPGGEGIPLPIPPEYAAGRITPDTPESVRIRGSDAIAGVGDWFLSNGFVCAAVLSADEEGQLIGSGGTLVDLGHCDRDDDQFIGLEPLFNLSRSEILAVTDVRAEVDAQSARLITLAEEDGIRHETTFSLDIDDPARIRIQSKLTRIGEGARFFAMAELLQHQVSSLRNFTLNRSKPSRGFAHISLEESAYLDIASAIRAVDAVVLVGSSAPGPEIAYGYHPLGAEYETPDGAREALGHYALGMESVTFIAVLANPLLFPADDLGVLQAAQGLVMDIEVGATLHYERVIRLTRHSDVASFSDRLFSAPERPAPVTVRGRLDTSEALIHVDRPGATSDIEGDHVTVARPNSTGRFELKLPPGSYVLRILATADRQRRDSIELLAEQAGGAAVDLGFLPVGPPARIRLPRGSPMRLRFVGSEGSADPIFGDDLTGLTINGIHTPSSLRTRDVHLAGSFGDPSFVDVPPGRYEVFATRGIEFGITRTSVEAIAGVTTVLEIDPPLRALETPGWISADFHVHAGESFDSTLPQQTRLRSWVAEGGEILVASEHDVITSYAGAIAELGLQNVIRTITGIELTSISHGPAVPHTSGHMNIFPLIQQPQETRRGAPPHEGQRLREIIGTVRKLPGDPILQLNHPRDPYIELHDESLFDHLGVLGEPFDPNLPLESEPNRILIEPDPKTGIRDIDFDAFELLNGYDMPRYREIRADWFALLRQGLRPTANANSDSHRLGRIVNVPRSYVQVSDDRIEAFSQEEFMAAVRRGAVYGSTGPILDVRLDDAGIGDRFSGDRGTLKVAVRAAPWIPLSTLRVYINGALNTETAISGPTEQEIPLQFAVDSFVIVEVLGEPGGDYRAVLERFTPVAFTNPIWVDADGDGEWSAPGLAVAK